LAITLVHLKGIWQIFWWLFICNILTYFIHRVPGSCWFGP
jgi:hypothetical protein